MIWQCLGLLVLGLVFSADDKDDAAKKELAKLEGEWTVVSAEREGKPIPEDDTKHLKRIVKGHTFEIKNGDMSVNKGMFTIDVTKKPKTIVIVRDGAGEKGTMHGIYELDGDTYKICYGPKSRPIATEFATKPDSGLMLMVWKKAKK